MKKRNFVKMNNKPVVEFAGEKWIIDAVMGDEWNDSSEVFIDEAFIGTKFEIRYNMRDIIYPAFQYQITSRKLNSKKTSYVTAWGSEIAKVTEVRGIIHTFDDNEELSESFGCVYFLRQNF